MDQIRAGNVSNHFHVSYASDGTKDKNQTIVNNDDNPDLSDFRSI